MFDVLSMWVEDFKSFQGRHEFEFPTEPGLYYATGKNLDNPRLGANGVGKSTFLIDALHWCFYGKTPRGLRATDVIEWFEGTSCAVGVSVLVDDEVLNIVRTQKPNSLKLNDRTVDQEELTATLRLNPDAFTYSIVMPQFGQHFFDLRPGDKLTLFSQIMDLDFWLDKSKEASNKAKALEELSESLARQLANSEGTIETLKEQRKGLKRLASEFDAEQGDLLAGLKNKMKKINDEIREINPTVSKLRKSTKSLRRKYEAANEEMYETKRWHREALDAVEHFKAEIRESKRLRQYIQEELNSFSQLKGTKCPTCRQRVDKDHFERHSKGIREKIQNVDNEIAEFQSDLEEALAAEDETKKDLENKRKVEERLLSEHNAAAVKLQNTEHTLKLLERDKQNLSSGIKEISNRKNPHTDMLKRTNKKIGDLVTQINSLRDEIEITLVKHEATSYWISGFKKIRLFIIEEAIKGLEIEVNNNLTNLGLLDWEIRFDVERENKSGGITKGFSVFIHIPRYPKPVRWEAFSGGETQRLRLAGDMGLANLILERVGLVSAFEVHDEPSEHLSPEGLADTVETLHDRAHSLDRKIWLVEQHSVDFGGFSGKLTVTKDENGSHLEYED